MTPKTGTKNCIECYHSIPSQASKCAECGGYQSIRRFLPAWSNLLALVVSALALLTSLWGNGRLVVETVSQYLSRDSFKLNAAVVDLSLDQSTFAVTNISEQSAVITSLQCSLFLPIDPNLYLLKAATEGRMEKYRWKETVGMFLVSLDPVRPIQIAAGEQAVVKFNTRHVSPVFGNDRFEHPREPEEFVSSFCSIGGVRGNNELIGGALFLNTSDTFDLDALEFLKIADYSEQQISEREALQHMILSARSAAE
ncbi:MAG: hypothetical protein ABJN72_10515 [Sulfitobacter sp.]